MEFLAFIAGFLFFVILDDVLGFFMLLIGYDAVKLNLLEQSMEEFMAGISPLNDRVLIKVDVADEKLGTGVLFAPGTAQKAPDTGKVIAIGKGKVMENGVRVPLDVKVGDRVMFDKYADGDVEIEGVKHKLITESQILGVID